MLTPSPEHRRFAENIMHFARALRVAGLPVGPGKVLDAIRAVAVTGIRRRDDFYWTLHAVFVNRRDQRELFDQAFHIFWRNPRILEQMMGLMLPSVDVDAGEEKATPASNRVAEAFLPPPRPNDAAEGVEDETEAEASLTWSDRERLQKMDFETMTGAELVAAKQAIARLRLPMTAVPTRRFHASTQGKRIDMRATLRGSLRAGTDTILLKRKKVVYRHPPLVILCDISGSMTRYSRMFLHFLHAITNDRDRVHTFVFGTRLTNITRQLRQRDVDVALNRIGQSVEDWSGGTRIGHTIGEFNRQWSRRVLGQGAVVLLISDGLDRDAGVGLAMEMQRLHKSCRRLIWLNPLLRWEGFEPKSQGIKAILPHVDEFRPVHNLQSLSELAAALSSPQPTPDALFAEEAAA